MSLHVWRRLFQDREMSVWRRWGFPDAEIGIFPWRYGGKCVYLRCKYKKKGVHHEDIYHHIAYLDSILYICLSPSPTQERKEKVFQGSKGIEGKKGAFASNIINYNINGAYSTCEVEIQEGDQPIYYFLLSAE